MNSINYQSFTQLSTKSYIKMPAYMTRYQIRCKYGDSPKSDKLKVDIETKQESYSVSEASKQILKEAHNRFQKNFQKEYARLINKVKELEKRVVELEKLLKKQNINPDCSVESVSDDSYDSDCSVESDDSNDSDYVM